MADVSPNNPFSPSEAGLVVDVTPADVEKSEDPNHPKRQKDEESPDPQKRPKVSEDFEDNPPLIPAPEPKPALSEEQKELQMTACRHTLDTVKMLKEEAKRFFAQEEYLKALSKYEEAISAFSKLLVPAEFMRECQDQRAELLNNIALCCFRLQDSSLALKITEQAVKEFPDRPKLVYSYARALCSSGDYDLAIAHLKRLARALPDNQQILDKLKEVQKEKEDHLAKLKGMFGGKLQAPVKTAKPEGPEKAFPWGLVAAFAGLTIGGFFLARHFLSK